MYLFPEAYLEPSLNKTWLPPRRLEDVFKICLQCNNFSSSKTSSWRLEDVFKTYCERSWKRLQDVLEDVKLLRWRCLQDVFKTSWRPTNVCWVIWNIIFEIYLRYHIWNVAYFVHISNIFSHKNFLKFIFLYLQIQIWLNPRKVSEYGVISGRNFPVFGLNTEILLRKSQYSVRI